MMYSYAQCGNQTLYAMTFTYSLMDLLTLGMVPIHLVTTLLEFFNLDASIEMYSTAMAGNTALLIRRPARPVPYIKKNKRKHSTSNYWEQVAALDDGQDTNNVHILAARILALGRPVTVDDINAVQATLGQPVTPQELDVLCNLPFVTYPLTVSGVIDPKFLELYPPKVPVGKGR